MSELTIKTYDVLIVRILQLILPILISYVSLLFLSLVFDGKAIEPFEYFEYVLLFDGKPIALVVGWGIITGAAFFLLKGTGGVKLKESFIMRRWLSFKAWALPLGSDFE